MLKSFFSKITTFSLMLMTIANTPGLLYSQSKALDFFTRGKVLFNEKKYFQAGSFFRKSLKINPYFLKAQLYLADSYFMTQHYHQAYKIYLQAQNINPDNPKILLKLAQSKIKLSQSKEDLEGARFYLQKAYKLTPRDPDIIAAYGYYYYLLGDYSKAMQFYNILGTDSKSISILLNKADVYLKQNYKNLALKELQKAEILDTNNIQVLIRLAQFHTYEKQFKQAAGYLKAIERIDPHNKDALSIAAHSYLKNHQYQLASENLSKLLEIDPSNLVLYYNLAFAQESLGENKKAIKTLLTGLKYNSSNEFLRIKAEQLMTNTLPIQSDMRKKMSEYYNKEAIESTFKNDIIFALQRSLLLYPFSQKVRLKLAKIYRSQGLIYSYIRLLDAGLFIDPNNKKLKSLKKLNQKFTLKSLEAKTNIDAKPSILLEPILRIDNVFLDPENEYQFFETNLKQEFFNELSQSKRFSIFIKDKNNISKKADFLIDLKMITTHHKTTVSAEINYSASGALYKKYTISEYGNNQLHKILSQLKNKMIKDIPMVGSILKIAQNKAIVNFGKKQGIKKGMKVDILKNSNFFRSMTKSKKINLIQPIAFGTVTRTGENISEIIFKPNSSLVFNMVETYGKVILQKSRKK